MITDDKKSILERVNFFCAFFIWSDPSFILVVFFPTYISELINNHIFEYFWLTALIKNCDYHCDVQERERRLHLQRGERGRAPSACNSYSDRAL